MDAHPSTPIVLIGPMGAGKSTVARALARRLELRLVPLDAIRWYYHLVDGFSFTNDAVPERFSEVVRGWEPYSIAAVERVVGEFPDGVLDFGAGHAHYEDPDRVLRLGRALAPIPNVILLLPSEDPERCDAICRARDQERLGPAWNPTRADLNARFIRSACFRQVATTTLFVEERSVDQTVDALIAGLR